MIFNVKGQSLELIGGNIIAEGAVEFASFTLESDSSWDTFSKTVRFRHVSQEETYDVAGVVDGKVYYIPAEVLVRGSVFVSVLGVSGTTRISTTELAGFFVEGTVDSGKTPNVTENAYAQYVDMIREKCLEVEESLTVAEKCRDDAEGFAKSTADIEAEVKASAEACRDYASFCQKVSGEVSGAEQSMNSALEGVRDSVETLLSHDHSLSIAENERVAGENTRADNERMRELAESQRVLAEKERADAESERIAAERGRVAGEAERNSKLSELGGRVNSIADSLFFAADGIVGKIESQNIKIDDAVKKAPLKFGILGKCRQDGVPDRNNPVAIESVADAEGNIKITHRGKNFIKYPYDFTRVRTSGVLFEALDDGGVRISGETTDKKAMLEMQSSDYRLPAGHYIVSGGTAECGVFVYDNKLSDYIARSNGGDVEFTIDSERKICVRLYIFPKTVVEAAVIYPMIRYCGVNGTYSKWEEHEYALSLPAQLHSVEGACDRITLVDHGKNAYLEKNVEKYVADGTEAISLIKSEGDYNTFSIIRNDNKSAKLCNSYTNKGWCNYLPYTNKSSGECCWTQGNELFVKVASQEFADVPSVSAFLNKCFADGTPFEVVYLLQSTELSEYSWDDDISLMQEVNILSSDTGNIFIEYIKNTTTVYESIIDTLLSLDARVSLLEV